MFPWPPSLLVLARRRAALVAAVLLATQMSLFAHAVGHDYVPDADQVHVVCGLCLAAHQLDGGLAPAPFDLPPQTLATRVAATLDWRPAHVASAVFRARAPPALSHA
ncbi:MAG: hypothetical protein AB7I01_10875 [Gammaproteobacteria bacterium]